MLEKILPEVQALRIKLHSTPELALQEKRTKALLTDYIRNQTNLEILDLGAGFCVYHQGTDSRSPVAFRADFDAVSGKDGCPGHFCGHDGHSAILAGFAKYISLVQPVRSIYLIFQPAEETGQGALLCRHILREKGISEIYGFHNIPGYPAGTVLLRKHTFACASTGLEITVKGTPSHAAYPENGKNPSEVLAKLMLLKNDILTMQHKGLVLATVIGCELGSSAYGVSASQGTLRLTLRAEYSDDFKSLINAYTDEALRVSHEAGMNCSIRKVEEFAATENTSENVEAVQNAAEAISANIVYPIEPFRWSEDFGFYLEYVNGAYFGIGSGEGCPQLHTEGYEFPDEVIGLALRLLAQLVK